MDNANLTARVAAAIERVCSTLQSQAPFLSREVSRWVRQISPNDDPPSHFTHPRMFPILQLPAWLGEAIPDEHPIKPDLEFEQSVIDSSVNGYYYIRLTDDVMDGDRDRNLELSILPAAGLFCSQFQFYYQAYFPPQHEFWRMFHELWIASCESAARDGSFSVVSWSDFEQVASRKYSAACIPVAAVCYHYDRPDLIAPWLGFTNDFARWAQMLDDLLDWHQDRRDRRATYFLSEGERRKRGGESLEQWVAREGHIWAFDLLEQWMRALNARAAELGSASLRAYLGQREDWLRQQKSTMLKGFEAISRLAEILGQASLRSDSGVMEQHEVSG